MKKNKQMKKINFGLLITTTALLSCFMAQSAMAQQNQQNQNVSSRILSSSQSFNKKFNNNSNNKTSNNPIQNNQIQQGNQSNNKIPKNAKRISASKVPKGATVYIRNSNGKLVPYKKGEAIRKEAAANRKGNKTNSSGSGMNLPPPPQLPNKRKKKSKTELQRQAMKKLFEKKFGVTPEDLKRAKRENQKRKKAAQQAATKPPKPVTRTINVSLQPGKSPQIIRTYYGRATSLVVTDSTGNPWPVVNYSLGNKSAFSIKRLDSGQSSQAGKSGGSRSSSGSMFSISPKKAYAHSNLILALKGKSTPVTLTLVSGQKQVDYNVDARVMALGPNANMEYANMPQSASTNLLKVLDGVPPHNSRRLKVSGQDSGQTTVWLKNNNVMIVRTNLTIRNPVPKSYVGSPSGTHVYKFAPTSPFLAEKNGKYVNIRVSGW